METCQVPSEKHVDPLQPYLSVGLIFRFMNPHYLSLVVWLTWKFVRQMDICDAFVTVDTWSSRNHHQGCIECWPPSEVEKPFSMIFEFFRFYPSKNILKYHTDSNRNLWLNQSGHLSRSSTWKLRDESLSKFLQFVGLYVCRCLEHFLSLMLKS